MTAVSLWISWGESGTVIMTAPFPSSLKTEAPLLLVAEIITTIDEPQGKLNGATKRSAIGTLHSKFAMIVLSDPSQPVKY